MGTTVRHATLLVGLALATSGCTTVLGIDRCDAPARSTLTLAPPTLAGTGLFAEGSTHGLAPDVRRYRPRFELVGDGAGKDRFVKLPRGATIDTTDMDDWQFPRGTKLWKDFARDGHTIETRYLEKVGDGAGEDAWLAVAYVWNAEGTDALLAIDGVEKANGTSHEVPPARRCRACHGGTRSFVLGYSAVQLGGAAEKEESELRALAREGRLSEPPRGDYALPARGDAHAALGYLHANCGHCHNRHRPSRTGARCFDPRTSFDLSLRTTELGALATTGPYRTAIGDVIVPGAPEDSALYRRFTGASVLPRMPALGTNDVDRDGAALLARWIRSLH